MKELLEFILSSIADQPEEIAVEEIQEEENIVVLKIQASAADMGKIIGREGKTIRAIRTIINTKAIREGKRVFVELVEESHTE